jgi:hypothetical protein
MTNGTEVGHIGFSRNRFPISYKVIRMNDAPSPNDVSGDLIHLFLRALPLPMPSWAA